MEKQIIAIIESYGMLINPEEDINTAEAMAITMDLYSHVLPNTKQKEMDNLKIVL